MSAICIPHLRRKGVERGSGLVIGYLDEDVDVWKGASSNHQARVPTTERSFPIIFGKHKFHFFLICRIKFTDLHTHTHKQLWSSSSLNCVGAVSKEQKKNKKITRPVWVTTRVTHSQPLLYSFPSFVAAVRVPW